MTANIVGFGASHIEAIERACINPTLPRPEGISATILSTRRQPYYPAVVETAIGQWRINPAFQKDLAAQIEAKAPVLLFCSLAGGEYAVYGFAQHPNAFHVFDPLRHEEIHLKPGTQIVPYDALRHRFARALGGAYALAKWVVTEFDRPLYQLCPPPPIGDNGHVARAARPELRRQLNDLGPAPRSLRLALWRAYTDAMRMQCQEVGGIFMEPPDAAFDSDGFLHADFFGRDLIHGNPSYGRLILQQLAEKANGIGNGTQHD
jgi:hypothetical protein